MPRPSPASTRVVELLNFLAAHPGESFRLSELARRVGFNKATAHGMLAVLADAEYLVYDPADKTFSLGPSVIELSMSATRYESKLAAFAQDEMEALAKAVGAQCLANTVVGDEFLVIATAGKPAAGAQGAELGYRGRLVPPIGVIFHAWASDAVIDRWLDRASADEGERIRYRKLLSAVRERGFSVSADREARVRLEQALAQLRDGNGAADARGTLMELIADISRDEHELQEIVPEHRHRVRQISAPVFDAQGAVRMGMLITGLPELSGAELLECAALTVAAAGRVTQLVSGDPEQILAPA